MKKLFLLAFAAVISAACSEDDSDSEFVVCPHGSRVSFESSVTDLNGEKVVPDRIDIYTSGNVVFSKDKVFWAKPYAVETDDYDQRYLQGPYIFVLDGDVTFGGYYDDGTLFDFSGEGKVTDVWGGFVLSQHANRSATANNMELQFDVWAKGGANGSKTFAVGYDGNTAGAGWMPSKEYNAPQIEFAHAVKPYMVFLANSAYTYTYFTGEDTDSFTVEVTGWLNDAKGRTVSCKLVDGAAKVSDWVMVDLSSLGEVDKLTFATVITDAMAPCYFCLDDLCFD